VSKVCHYVQALIDPLKQIAHISGGLLVDSHLHEASHSIPKKKHLGSKRSERLSGQHISVNREVFHRRERIRRARGRVNSTKLPVAAKWDHLPQTGPLLEIDLGDYSHCLLSNFGCVDAGASHSPQWAGPDLDCDQSGPAFGAPKAALRLGRTGAAITLDH
jgi:hypothetical protein